MGKMSKERVLNIVKTKKFIAIAGVVAVALGIFTGVKVKAYMKQGDINYISQFYDLSVSAINTGTFRYTLDIQNGDASDSKDVVDEDEGSTKKGSSTYIDLKQDVNKAVNKDGSFTDSWTGLDGVKKSESKNKHYRLDYTGVVSSIDPLTAQGSVELTSSTADSKLKLLDYKVVEGVWYVNLPETKKALQDSGSENLIAIGNEMPDYGSIIRFEKSDFIVDSIFGDEYVTDIGDMNYINERKELLRIITVATNNLQPIMKGIEPTVYAKEDNKYYFTIDKNTVNSVTGALDKFNSSSDKMFDSYLNKCVTDNVFDEDTKSLKEDGKDKVVELVDTGVNKLNNILNADEFKSVNWIRLTGTGENAKAELSIQASWLEDGEKHIISLTGENSRVVDKKLTIIAPKSSIQYSKTARKVESLKLTKLIESIKTALDNAGKDKPKEESKQPNTATK